MKTKDFVAIAMMAALLAVLGLLPAIPLGFIPVPIVLQNLGVMLAGVLLGGKRGSLALLLFLVIGLVLPFFSGMNTTLKVMVGPTAGYIWAWIFVPPLMSWGLSALKTRKFLPVFFIIWLSGVLFVDLSGGLYLSLYSGIPLKTALISSNLVFIPGDSLKALLTTAVALRLDRANLFKPFLGNFNRFKD
ncbi:biotin transporter BioY [Streptococcus dentapri]|uniref:Biotin transporter n=1 Tax=Streptococcus dentapri TaxID=573564 RepID=A0ABV8D1R9_9STRE